jgi:SAM-dependent methyltransferase
VFSHSAAFYDLLYGERDYAAEAATVRGLLRELAARPLTTLLDVGCATGGHLASLRAHFDVAGCDVQPELLERARERLDGVALHQADVCELELGHRFDAIVSLYGSLAYVCSPERLAQAYRRLADHLEPGGVLLVEPWYTPASYSTERREREVRGDGLHVRRVGHRSRLRRRGRGERYEVARLYVQYYVTGPTGLFHIRERHEIGLFEPQQHIDAMNAAGLIDAEYRDGGVAAAHGVLLVRGTADPACSTSSR